MSVIYYADAAGNYLGCVIDGEAPQGGIEVPAPPHSEAKWVNNAWSFDAAAEARKRMVLSFAQLLIGLVSEGWITEAQGEAWLGGVLPAPVLAVILTLPAGARFAAKARATQPSVVERTDPLVAALAAAQGKTAAELDAFFTTYAGA